MNQVPANRSYVRAFSLLILLTAGGLCALTALRILAYLSLNAYRVSLPLLIALSVLAFVFLRRKQQVQYKSLSAEQRSVVDQDAQAKLQRAVKAAKRMATLYAIGSIMAILSVWSEGKAARLITATAAFGWVGLQFWLLNSYQKQLAKLNSKLDQQASGDFS